MYITSQKTVIFTVFNALIACFLQVLTVFKQEIYIYEYHSFEELCNCWTRTVNRNASLRLHHTCMTFMEAAPARPTFIVTGFTSADLAKFWIFLGIVAENRSV
jgi:hypothetical protein